MLKLSEERKLLSSLLHNRYINYWNNYSVIFSVLMLLGTDLIITSDIQIYYLEELNYLLIGIIFEIKLLEQLSFL